MPTYDYHCHACDHRFEHFQSMKDPVLRKCPKCGKAKLERLIGTGAAIIFKGSGFYQTDYRSEGYKKAADADKPVTAATTDAKAASSETPTPSAAPEAAGKSAASPPPKVVTEPKPAAPRKTRAKKR